MLEFNETMMTIANCEVRKIGWRNTHHCLSFLNFLHNKNSGSINNESEFESGVILQDSRSLFIPDWLEILRLYI